MPNNRADGDPKQGKPDYRGADTGVEFSPKSVVLL